MKSLKKIRKQHVKKFGFSDSVTEVGEPYKDSKGAIYQQYLNGMVRKITTA